MTARTRYSTPLIALHWLTLLLIVATYFFILVRTEFPKGSDTRLLVKTLHFSFGLTVFAVVWLRLAARFANGPAPTITPALPRWQHLASKATHVALYGLMIGMPIGGLLILSFEGDPIPYFNLFTIAPLVAPDKELAEVVEELHETGGTIGYFLIGLHALAGLYHHYVKRDNTMARMLPGREA